MNAAHRTLRAAGAAALFVLFASCSAAGAQEAPPGKALYDKYCAQCHGDQGDGNGIAADFLKPRPRDFTAGKYKIRTTPSGGVPTDADLTRAIRRGLPYTGMPAFDTLSDAEVGQLVTYIKSFAPDFEDPQAQLPPIEIPTPPPYDPAKAAESGRKVYEQTGCARCHGETGRGDGMSAPTLVDDWGHHLRVADLTKPWTFRGGGTREDIFRTMSTGFMGTPMPGFHGSLPVEEIWAITDYLVYLGGNRTEAPYTNLLRAVAIREEIDLGRGRELFEAAPPAVFRIVGQVIEPGRQFYPAAVEVEARAIFNRDEIAFMVSWDDMRAETSGHNAPDLPAPLWREEHPAQQAGAAATEDEGGDFWGDAAESEDTADSGGGDDFWGDDAAADEGDDSAAGGDDFWGEEDGGTSSAPAGPDTEFSDAVAIQLPHALPAGIGRPYFLFGSAQDPVELWFVDLAKPQEGKLYLGRGSAAVTESEDDVPTATASYEQGRWTVILKRERLPLAGVPFADDSFLPIAFSIWDGFERERGNKRGLTTWYSLYLEPLEKPSVLAPTLKAGALVLAIELLLVGLVRWRKKRAAAVAA